MTVADQGALPQLFHGGRARLRPGQLLCPGSRPNPWGDTFDPRGRSVFVYCTSDLDTACRYAAAIATSAGTGRVYQVESTGPLRHDYGPGDYKSRHPLRIVRLVTAIT